MSAVEYPYVDELGFEWLDCNTFSTGEFGICFFCGTSTDKIDINFDAYYCGNDDESIRRELNKLEATTE